ncbi:hypothetical protein UPYG_G00249350 [Umbra pygmaea]|uniref:Uncharacterized protein n=1 Tax=Umbra pygmaea TaxID=75934 RepID=A0ABD0W791_UMBPY
MTVDTEAGILIISEHKIRSTLCAPTVAPLGHYVSCPESASDLDLHLVKMAARCKAGHDPRNGSHDLKKKAWYLASILLKLGFCLTLCARLEKLTHIKVTLVCIPLWCMLLGAMVELGYNIFPERREA